MVLAGERRTCVSAIRIHALDVLCSRDAFVKGSGGMPAD